MARIAIFTERYTIRRSIELTALTNFRIAAGKLGHDCDFIFRSEIMSIPRYDGLLIRALTDPLNTSYVAARMAQACGLRVLDEPYSIVVCCDKVNMYQHLMRAGVPIPDTCFLTDDQVTPEQAHELFERYGKPLVLKAPNSSFSAYVERVHDVASFIKIGRRFLRRADRLVVQQYLPSAFDWRVTILDGKVLSVVKYVMADGAWRIHDRDEEGSPNLCRVEGVRAEEVPPELKRIALRAGGAIGRSLYGVDIKQFDDGFVVIEVNDNPNIDAGNEDSNNPEVYRNVIRHLVGEPWEGWI
ncbi:MAG: RimK family alpha-L-glutamate ligase [Planctomycetota bacterium]|nr:RimK family alpha-L-glutamate ligase [Planctomycetota bacterium]MDW8372994.1 RimK family alpha-L-glutamate ligase [Planctomycetota bacterium]